ncbi:hypothetical protein [Streptomyces sp. TRM64462]|uniref:hypothetical protein n=1 Tax=Streptomyces sp. TRM64462 TaxID=2741726 RepID=UPI0020C815BD|nr:hypothetical protein [Streptomyces sp. TRM64462]
MSIVVTARQRGDSPQFEPALAKARVPRPAPPRAGPGRPRVRPDRVRADKAYGSRKNRAYLRRRGTDAPSRTTPTRRARPPKARLPRRPTAAFRPGRLPRAPCGRVWDQPPQEAPCCRPALQQARRPLRGDRPDRRDRRMAATGLSCRIHVPC